METNLAKMKEDSKERGKRFREKNPNYMKEYYQKIKDTFNQKYNDTIKLIYERNKPKIQARYQANKEFTALAQMQAF